MKSSDEILSGYRVVGPAWGGKLEIWYFGDLDYANAFAKNLSQDSGKPVYVTKLVGVWRPVVPVEYTPASDYVDADKAEPRTPEMSYV